MIVFAVEKWKVVKPSIMPLWEQHYDEIADHSLRLDPDWIKFDRLADFGMLHIVTARLEGELVGYVFALVDKHLHYASEVFAYYDLFWLRKDLRKGWAGVKMFRYAEQSLRDIGVHRLTAHVKLWKDVGPIFDRMGWRETERIYTKTVA